MKKLFLLMAVTLSCVVSAFSQPGTVAVDRWRGNRTADPATCSSTRGERYYNTSTKKYRYCSATNTWSDIGGSGGGLTTGSAVTGGGANRVFYEDGSQNFATDANLTYASSLLSAPKIAATGVAAVGSGTLEVPVVYNSVDTNTGVGLHGSDVMSLIGGGKALSWDGANNRFSGDSAFHITWNSGVNGAFGTGADTGVKRIQATVVGTTDGTTVTGIIPGVQFAVNSSDTTMGNVATAQSPFAAANDALTVAASTTYFFEAQYYLTTGATTHTTATLFGGTATLTSIGYWSELWSVTDGTISTTAPSVLRVAVGTATVLNATSTATATTIRLRGVIRVNAGGTLIPQIQFSADPTGTILGKTNSYFRIWPAGTNTVASVGPWN